MKISTKILLAVFSLIILIVSIILFLSGHEGTDAGDDIEKKCRKVCEKKYRPGTAAFKVCVDGCKFSASQKEQTP
jgi:hypothetical protein